MPSGRIRPVRMTLLALAAPAVWALLVAEPGAWAGHAPPRDNAARPARLASAAGPSGPGAVWIAARAGEVTPEKLERWRRMTPEERDRIRERYQRWKSLTPGQRERILERSRRLRELPEEDRHYLRERRRLYREAPPGEKRVFEEFFRHMRQLPPPQRRQVRKSLAEMRGLPPGERDARLSAWPYYRGLAPAERRILRDFLFAGPPPPHRAIRGRPAPPGRGGTVPPNTPGRPPEGRAAPPE